MRHHEPVAPRGVIRHHGRLLSYQDLGPVNAPGGPLIHGMVSDSTTWARAAGQLAEHGHRVLAPDLLGHGDSDKPDDGYQLADFADSLAALLTELDAPDASAARLAALPPELGAHDATVVGHSFGGAVAMQLAYDHPELVRRLVLVSA